MHLYLRLVKFGLAGFAALLLTVACEKKEEETPATDDTTDDGSTESPSINLSGTFNSSCQPISGSTYGAGTHKKIQITFGLTTGANRYEYVTLYMNSGCSTTQYSSSHKGTFEVQTPTTTPANGYAVLLNSDQANLIVNTDAAYNDFISVCPGTGAYSPAPSIKSVTSVYTCMNISNFEPAPGSYHNIVVLSGNTLQWASTGDNNEGFANAGSVPTTLSLTLTK